MVGGDTVGSSLEGKSYAIAIPESSHANHCLHRRCQNLMVYRHPSILKFMHSSSMHHTQHGSSSLVTERCLPLRLAVPENSPAAHCRQSDIDIRLGLRSILCALTFLVEQADARHLNICPASVYITATGCWRLAGFEYVWKADQLTDTLLKQSQPLRWKSGVDASGELLHRGLNVEQYAFGALCNDVLSQHLKNESTNNQEHDDASIVAFMRYCATQLCNEQAPDRPRLAAIQQHPFFRHDFIAVHSFLVEELPLKSLSERAQFFTNLIERLRRFDERDVAAQLTDLLLSRIVLTDPTAQQCVVPQLLTPNHQRRVGCAHPDAISGDSMLPNVTGLFAVATFQRYLIPRIVQLFDVREVQTRLVLLEHFAGYMSCCDHQLLRERLLPLLLLGIRDQSDSLVAATLRALAELVPVLGATSVIGRNRAPIFTDGRPHVGPLRHTKDSQQQQPKQHQPQQQQADLSAVSPDWKEHRSITPVLMTTAAARTQHATRPCGASMYLDRVECGRQLNMPERLSPDGGEDVRNTSYMADLETDAAWSDWEEAEPYSGSDGASASLIGNVDGGIVGDVPTDLMPILLDTKMDDRPKVMLPARIEIDYFADMEPIIQKSNVVVMLPIQSDAVGAVDNVLSTVPSHRLQPQTAVDEDALTSGAGAWDNEVDGWGDVVDDDDDDNVC